VGCLAAEPLPSVRVELVAVGAPDSGVLVEYRRKYDEGGAFGDQRVLDHHVLGHLAGDHGCFSGAG